MFYRLALTSSLLLVSSFALDRAALGQSAEIPFTGTVPIQTTFNGSTPGIAEPTFTVGSTTNTNKYESVTPAIVSVQSSTSATITISPPRFVSGPTTDPSGTTHIGLAKFGATTFRSDFGGGSTTLPAGNTNIEVNMLVERPVAFAPGSYVYAVTLTITP